MTVHPQHIFEAILAEYEGENISDIQIRTGRLVYVHTKHGLDIIRSFGELPVEMVEAIAEWLYTQQDIDRYRSEEEASRNESSIMHNLRERRVIDFSCEGLQMPSGAISGRMRVQAHLSQEGLGITCRILNDGIADLDMLGLSPDTCLALREFVKRRQGLGLVTGQTGSGKSTTLAALINWLKENCPRHIVTVEDPIEYRYEKDMPHPEAPETRVPAPGIVTQQQVGMHVKSYQQGLKDVLRKAPHVILIGEIRDKDTMNTCIEAAQTGHIVISTLHTNGAVKTLSRILEFFPRDQHRAVLGRLSEILMFILSQGLLIGNQGRVLNYEFLQNTTASVRSGIAHYDGGTRSLDDVIRQSGNVEWDQNMLTLFRRGLISRETYVMNRMNMDDEDEPIFGEMAVGY